MRLMIIGGSDAGISAGLRAKQFDPSCEVTLVLADRYPNYSICGLPFYVSGETPEWTMLAHRSLADLEAAGLRLTMETRAVSIDPKRHAVIVERAGARRELAYDKLIIATGGDPVRPPIRGLERAAVHLLHTVDTSRALRDQVAAGARSALIVGGGYIGLEMADAFRHRGLEVCLVEMLDQVMATVDAPLAALILDELRRHGVTVTTGVAVSEIAEANGRLSALGARGFEAAADVVLVVVGVRPSSDLARATGVETGIKGAIRVNRRMETNLADVFAAGDCVETYHRMLDRPTYLPLGTTAHKQGRVAGENAVGGSAEFQGSLGTQVVKVFDLAVARTGLRDKEAEDAGLHPLTVETVEWDHKAYYPGAHQLSIRVTGDRLTGELLGAQIVGDHRGEVAKRIDIFAIALSAGMAVGDLPRLDLSYTPPFAAPWDAVQVAADRWLTEA